MSERMSARHIDNRFMPDPFFGASSACAVAVGKNGKENVINATLGAVYDEQENLVCLPTVEKMFRSLKIPQFAAYAPISGTAEYLEAVERAVFSGSRPEAFTAACATPGGSGAIRNAMHCYSEIGEAVLTHDWFWGPYRTMAENSGRRIETFAFFDETQKFNVRAFSEKADELLARQSSLLIIINSPGHNPVGYSLTDAEWGEVAEILRAAQARTGKKVILVADIAYIDFAGERETVRAFMRKLGDFPEKMLVLIAFSMSKSYTLYGQRCGALVGVSRSNAVIEEFRIINERLARATWSNCNRGAMQILVDSENDRSLQAQIGAERKQYVDMISARAAKFEKEAQACELSYLPYRSGFFISIPANQPQAVWEALARENVFGVALGKGVRIAICGVPLNKMTGVAGKIVQAIRNNGG